MAPAGDDDGLIFEAHRFCSLRPGAATTIERAEKESANVARNRRRLRAGASGRWPEASSGVCVASALRKDGFKKLYHCLVGLARWRATE